MPCAHLSPRSPAPLQPRTRAHMGRVAVVSAAAAAAGRVEGIKKKTVEIRGRQKEKGKTKASQTDQLDAEVASLRVD